MIALGYEVGEADGALLGDWLGALEGDKVGAVGD